MMEEGFGIGWDAFYTVRVLSKMRIVQRGQQCLIEEGLG